MVGMLILSLCLIVSQEQSWWWVSWNWVFAWFSSGTKPMEGILELNLCLIVGQEQTIWYHAKAIATKNCAASTVEFLAISAPVRAAWHAFIPAKMLKVLCELMEETWHRSSEHASHGSASANHAGHDSYRQKNINNWKKVWLSTGIKNNQYQCKLRDIVLGLLQEEWRRWNLGKSGVSKLSLGTTSYLITLTNG